MYGRLVSSSVKSRLVSSSLLNCTVRTGPRLLRVPLTRTSTQLWYSTSKPAQEEPPTYQEPPVFQTRDKIISFALTAVATLTAIYLVKSPSKKKKIKEVKQVEGTMEAKDASVEEREQDMVTDTTAELEPEQEAEGEQSSETLEEGEHVGKAVDVDAVDKDMACLLYTSRCV